MASLQEIWGPVVSILCKCISHQKFLFKEKIAKKTKNLTRKETSYLNKIFGKTNPHFQKTGSRNCLFVCFKFWLPEKTCLFVSNFGSDVQGKKSSTAQKENLYNHLFQTIAQETLVS